MKSRTNLFCTRRGRWARSTFQLLEALPDAGAALTQWNLSTGRTHQIRVHAQHVGHPLLGDDAYGGAGGAALFVLAGNNVERCVPNEAYNDMRNVYKIRVHVQHVGHPPLGNDAYGGAGGAALSDAVCAGRQQCREVCCCFNLDARYEGHDAYSGASGAALFVLTGNLCQKVSWKNLSIM